MAVRVLRLLEYVFETAEQADVQMAHWQLPANGARKLGDGSYIRSSVITEFNWPTLDELAQVPRNTEVFADIQPYDKPIEEELIVEERKPDDTVILDKVEDPKCPYTHSHLKEFCGYAGCREI